MIGRVLGSYQVLSKLGAGGMGEVYRAKDTNLNRDVALKILPESFALDADRVARFKREAQVLASLNHPNIAQIYGIESNALVMELVDGEDLSAVIARGAIPLADALLIAKQIADALEAAHEQGIVHRDLKPANVKVRADGTVKVLDFGLARTMDVGPGTSDAANSPTLTARSTQLGMIIGTAAYMSPEQARGKAVDRRADIWAFGVVLYEMLTGRRAFEGDDISITLASVLKDDVKLELLPAELPPALRRLLRRCLEKDPKKRLSSIGDARLEIDDAIAGTPDAPQLEPVAAGGWTGWARLSAALALVSIALATWLAVTILTRPSADNSQPVITRFSLVNDQSLHVNTWATTPFAVSRDGQLIVFGADAGTGTFLWVRRLADAEPRVLADTQGAYQPAISPDGEWVAFVVANHQIKKIRLDGSGLTAIATIDDTTAALAWTSNDEIIFERIGSNSGIQRVSASGGGKPQLLIPPDVQAHERSQRRPLVLLDERRVLYQSGTSDGRSATIAAFSLDDGRRVRLEIEGTQPLGVFDGHLVYARGDGALMAVPFDASGMRVLGLTRQLADRVAVTPFGTSVTLSPAGTLVALPPTPQLAQMLLSDLSGNAAPISGPTRAFDSARFSPDGRRIAVSISENGADLWFIDRASGDLTRLTRETGGQLADWTRDSKALIFARNNELWTTPVDGSAGPRKLATIEGRVIGASMLPDGRSVVVARRITGAQGEVDREELVRVSLDGKAEVTIIIASRSSGATMRFGEVRVSPDGKWVAFQERNERQIHVHALDGASAVQVSDAGGDFPAWSADGRRLFYQTSTGIMVADLETGSPLSVRRQRIPALRSSSRVTDASPDGRTLLMLVPTDPSSKVMVTLNWAAQLRRQLGK